MCGYCSTSGLMPVSLLWLSAWLPRRYDEMRRDAAKGRRWEGQCHLARGVHGQTGTREAPGQENTYTDVSPRHVPRATGYGRLRTAQRPGKLISAECSSVQATSHTTHLLLQPALQPAPATRHRDWSDYQREANNAKRSASVFALWHTTWQVMRMRMRMRMRRRGWARERGRETERRWLCSVITSESYQLFFPLTGTNPIYNTGICSHLGKPSRFIPS